MLQAGMHGHIAGSSLKLFVCRWQPWTLLLRCCSMLSSDPAGNCAQVMRQ